jgi:8-amino-7-oxononanoate synthase
MSEHSAGTPDPLRRIRDRVAQRTAAGLRRELAPRAAGSAVLDLAGNDYLGLSRHPDVIAAAVAATRTWGTGSTGSRLVTGSTELHAELEAELAAFTGAGSALVFSSGYLANVGVLSALGGPEVTVVSDAGNHASLIDGCRLSGSPVTVTPHRDLDKIDAALAARDTEHSLVVTDAVFSVAGDLVPVRRLHDVTRRHGALLVVDEAHALGVVGKRGEGAVAAAGLGAAPDVIRTATLSKSLGAQGGAVLAVPEIVELMVSTARTFIFDTGLAPGSAGAALAALRILTADATLPARTRAAATRLAGIVAGLGVPVAAPDAAVVPAVLGDPRVTVAAAARCLELGVRVGCFRPPSVPVGGSCLRLTARADLSADDLDRAESVLGAALPRGGR